jgi:hypothetical protein
MQEIRHFKCSTMDHDGPCMCIHDAEIRIREFAPIKRIEYRPQLTSAGHRTIVSGSDARQSMRGRCKQEKTLM